MAKIFFPYIDRPKEFPFLLGRQIKFPFIVEDLVYYWTFTTEGITLYLHSEDISESAPILKDILLEDTGITFYLANGSIGTQASLAQRIYIEFEQIGKGIHTLGRLDPLMLGDIDPFTLGEISNISANWMALRNAIVTAVSNIASQGDNLQMRLESNSVVATEKAIFTGELSSFIHTTGLTKQRIMTLGELDSYVLEDIDMMLATFRAFENIPANIVKFIGVSHRNMLINALAENSMGSAIYSTADDDGILLKNDLQVGAMLANVSSNADEVSMRIDIGSSEATADIASNASESNIALGCSTSNPVLEIELTLSEHKTAISSSGISIEVTTISETT